MLVEILIGMIVLLVGVWLHYKYNKWNFFARRGIPELKIDGGKFWLDIILQVLV